MCSKPLEYLGDAMLSFQREMEAVCLQDTAFVSLLTQQWRSLTGTCSRVIAQSASLLVFLLQPDIFLRSLWCDMYDHKGPKLLFGSAWIRDEGVDLIMLSICTASVGWSADPPAGLQSGLKNNFLRLCACACACVCVHTSACACVWVFPLLPPSTTTHVADTQLFKCGLYQISVRTWSWSWTDQHKRAMMSCSLGVQHEGHCNRNTGHKSRKVK